tara:strand:+ start:352 stop:750 length:399 start_codon:yes stop_codon:yes gene_type:complete
MANPETNFWQQVKKNLPKYRWVRIESWATQGVPDLLGFTEEGKLFTVELKVSKSNRISISPHQIAFHVEREDCPCFILVKRFSENNPRKSEVLVYAGGKIREVSEQGTRINPLVRLSYPHDWSLIGKVFDNA